MGDRSNALSCGKASTSTTPNAATAACHLRSIVRSDRRVAEPEPAANRLADADAARFRLRSLARGVLAIRGRRVT